MRGAEIAGVGELGVGEARFHFGMAIGAELLRRRSHITRAFVLGVTLDTPARRLVEGGRDRAGKPGQPGRLAARLNQAGGVLDVVVDMGVASLAGVVADRDERLDVASLAIVL